MIHPLITYAATMHGVTAAEIVGPCRRQEVSHARAIACWLLAQQGLGIKAIGRLVRKHHTSVLYHLTHINRTPALLAHAKECLSSLQRLAREAVA